jgi:hypothetical protein
MTAPPVKMGLSDFGCMKNSPPLRQAKNAMHEADAQVRLLNEIILGYGHPFMHLHIWINIDKDNGTFCKTFDVG